MCPASTFSQNTTTSSEADDNGANVLVRSGNVLATLMGHPVNNNIPTTVRFVRASQLPRQTARLNLLEFLPQVRYNALVDIVGSERAENLIPYQQKYPKFKFAGGGNSSPSIYQHFHPLVDAILSGSTEATYSEMTDSIVTDIKFIIGNYPESLNTNSGRFETNYNMSPLTVACFNLSTPLDIVKLLLEKGANINCFHKSTLMELQVPFLFGFFYLCSRNVLYRARGQDVFDLLDPYLTEQAKDYVTNLNVYIRRNSQI